MPKPPLAQHLYEQVLACPHHVQHDTVTLDFDPKLPGKNALAQLHNRIKNAVDDLQKPVEIPDRAGFWWFRKNNTLVWLMVEARETSPKHIILTACDGSWFGMDIELAQKYKKGQWIPVQPPKPANESEQ